MNLHRAILTRSSNTRRQATILLEALIMRPILTNTFVTFRACVHFHTRISMMTLLSTYLRQLVVSLTFRRRSSLIFTLIRRRTISILGFMATYVRSLGRQVLWRIVTAAFRALPLTIIIMQATAWIMRSRFGLLTYLIVMIPAL